MSIQRFSEFKLNKTNESAFVVGNNIKVKLTFDIPQKLIKEYIEKTKSETGLTPLDYFNENEIAEEIVKYLVSQNLSLDNIPTDITVGTQKETNITDEDDDLQDFDVEFDIDNSGETEIEYSLEETDDDIEIEIEDFEIEDKKTDANKYSIKDYKKVIDEEEENVQDYDLDDLFKRIGYNTKK